MANNLLYQTTWEGQTIDENFANTVRVRIFNSPVDVVSNHYEKVVSTDGQTFQKSSRTSTKHTTNHTYVVLSTGICERFPGNSHYLYIKLYLTDDFDISTLKNENFLGKNYVIDAFQKYANNKSDENEKATIETPSSLLDYLQKKADSNYQDIYCRLKNSARIYDIDSVEQDFKNFNIPFKYQALFWKEMYQNSRNLSDPSKILL